MAAIPDRNWDPGLVGADDGVGDGFGGGRDHDSGWSWLSGDFGAKAGGGASVFGVGRENDGRIGAMTGAGGTRKARDEELHLPRRRQRLSSGLGSSRRPDCS